MNTYGARARRAHLILKAPGMGWGRFKLRWVLLSDEWLLLSMSCWYCCYPHPSFVPPPPRIGYPYLTIALPSTPGVRCTKGVYRIHPLPRQTTLPFPSLRPPHVPGACGRSGIEASHGKPSHTRVQSRVQCAVQQPGWGGFRWEGSPVSGWCDVWSVSMGKGRHAGGTGAEECQPTRCCIPLSHASLHWDMPPWCEHKLRHSYVM